MLHDRGTWCANRSCWPSTAAYSLERQLHTHTHGVTTDVIAVAVNSREVGGRTACTTARETQREQRNLITVTSSLLLQSCRHLCNRERLRT